MACVLVDSNNYLYVDLNNNDLSTCQYVIEEVSQYSNIENTSPEDIQASILFGFGFVTFCFLLGYSISQIKSAITTLR